MEGLEKRVIFDLLEFIKSQDSYLSRLPDTDT
jgi:hypothetical protein